MCYIRECRVKYLRRSQYNQCSPLKLILQILQYYIISNVHCVCLLYYITLYCHCLDDVTQRGLQ